MIHYTQIKRVYKGVSDLKKKILVVDDETVIRKLLCDILQQQGFETVSASNGDEALKIFWSETELSLILLDVMMPVHDGWEVLQLIRQSSNIPVIMLTALDSTADEIKGLGMGADDYISKPFSYALLIARVKTALRKANENDLDEENIECGEMIIDDNLKRVFTKGKEVYLSHKEYQLLMYLLQNQKIVLDRETILTGVWGYDYYGTERTVDTHIKTLRAKLGCCGDYIKTLRGSGYYLECEEES